MYTFFSQSFRQAAEQYALDQAAKGPIPESEQLRLERYRLGTPKAEEPAPRDIAPFNS